MVSPPPRNPGVPTALITEDFVKTHILILVTCREEELVDFISVPAGIPEIALNMVASEAEVLRAARELSPGLVIIDQQIFGVGNGLELVRNLLAVDARINTTMITTMSDNEWHERSEGLGMLPPLPDPPTAADAKALLERVGWCNSSPLSATT